MALAEAEEGSADDSLGDDLIIRRIRLSQVEIEQDRPVWDR